MADVSNVGGNQPIINLKNTGKTLDLNKLVGLRITDMNKSIFDAKYDLNGDGTINASDRIDANSDGIIDESEAGLLQKLLKKLAGNDNEATARDFRHLNVDKGDRQNYFNALQALADQQAAIENGGSYTDGNLKIEQCVFENTSGVSTTVTGEDKTTETIVLEDGREIIRESYNDGRAIVTRTEGDKTTVTTYETVNGKERLVEEVVMDIVDNKAVNTCIENIYDDSGNYTQFRYDGLDSSSGTLKSIKLENGRINITDITKGEDGTYTGKSEGSPVTFTITDGKVTIQEVVPETVESEPEVTTPQNATYTVVKNDSLWKIAADYLGEGATAGEISKAMHAIADANGLTIKNNRCMIHPGQQLTIPAEINKTGNTGTVDAGGGTVAGAEGASMAQDGNYTVVKGDTPAKIARNYLIEQLGYEPSAKQIRIYYQEIMDLNGIKDARKLQIGQVLQMPTISPMKINLPEGVTNPVTPPPANISINALEKYMNTTITPPSAQVPESYTLPEAYKEIHEKYAGQQGVKIGEQWFDFDAAGRITRVFDREPNRLNDEFDNASVEIYYNSDGNIKSYFGHEFNDQGQVTGCIKYNAQGKVTMFAQYSDWNAAGLPQCEDWFYADGTFQQREVVEYDENNQKVSESLSDSDGRFSSLLTYENGKQVQGLGIYTDSNGEKYITRYSDYNEEADNFTTGVHYELNGQRRGNYFWGNFEFDEQGRRIGYTVYNKEGTFDEQRVRKYTADGSKYKEMIYDANGNLTDVLWCDN